MQSENIIEVQLPDYKCNRILLVQNLDKSLIKMISLTYHYFGISFETVNISLRD